MNKNELILLKQTEITINKYYKEYIQFMNISFDMPTFEIKFRKATRDIFANVKEINGKYILTVDSLLCKTPFAKFTLYHEFTHIYDHTIMYQLGIDSSYMYHVYTEYHASQIEMMAELGCHSVLGKIENNIDQRSFYDKLLNEKTDFSKRVSLLHLSKTNDFSKAIDWFCYYIGKTNTFLYYFNEYSDTLLDLREFSNVFGNEIIPLQKQLFQCDSMNITIEDILSIADKHLLLVKKFNPQ